MANFTIPKGKRVRIRKYNPEFPTTIFQNSKKHAIEDINDMSFLLSTEFTFKVNSEFRKVVDYSPSTAQVMLQQATQFVSGEGIKEYIRDAGELMGGYYDWMGVQVWESTKPITASVTFDVLPNEVQKNVFVPIKALSKLVVPKVGEAKAIGGFKPLIFPGPNIFKELGIVDGNYPNAQDTITLCIGNLIFTEVIITDIEPTVSTDFTEDGFPAWAKIQVGFSTCRIATDVMLDEIFGSYTEMDMGDYRTGR